LISVSVALLLVQQSDAVWITSVDAVRKNITNKTLLRLAVPTAGTGESVGLLRRSDSAASGVAQECIKQIRAAARERSHNAF